MCVAQEKQLIVVQFQSWQQRLLHAASAAVHPPPVGLRTNRKRNIHLPTAELPSYYFRQSWLITAIIILAHVKFKMSGLQEIQVLPWMLLWFPRCLLCFLLRSSYHAPIKQNGVTLICILTLNCFIRKLSSVFLHLDLLLPSSIHYTDQSYTGSSR